LRERRLRLTSLYLQRTLSKIMYEQRYIAAR